MSIIICTTVAIFEPIAKGTIGAAISGAPFLIYELTKVEHRRRDEVLHLTLLYTGWIAMGAFAGAARAATMGVQSLIGKTITYVRNNGDTIRQITLPIATSATLGAMVGGTLHLSFCKNFDNKCNDFGSIMGGAAIVGGTLSLFYQALNTTFRVTYRASAITAQAAIAISRSGYQHLQQNIALAKEHVVPTLRYRTPPKHLYDIL
jgi:hypothetical protein